MNTFISLIKTSLNVNFGLSALKYKFTRDKKKLWEPILIGVSVIFGIGSLVFVYTLFLLSVFSAGIDLKQPEIVITVSFLFGQVFVLIFGIFYIMGAFYFSRDLNILIPLPLKPYEVLGSKFIVVMINEYLTLLPILLPPIIIYGIGTGQGLFYWVKGLVLILTSPVIPLVAGALFIVILMRFVNIRKSKDLLAILGGFLGIFIALGVNFFIQQIPKGSEQEFFKNMLMNQSGLIDAIGRKFPPSIWATLGLARTGLEGFGYFALFIVFSALLFLVLLWLGNQIFYKGLLSGQEVARKRKILSRTEINKQYSKTASPVMAIFWREWKLLLRTPIYVLNGLAGIIMGPFIALFAFITQGQTAKQINILQIMQKPEFIMPVTLGALGFMLFVSGMNLAASTSVSREGNTFWISKIIPVTPAQQVLGKFLNGFSISLLGILATAIVLIVFFKFSIVRIILLLFLGTLGSVTLVALSLIIDVFHPKLTWTNPQEAIKQNMNGVLGMIVSILMIVVLGFIAVVLALLKMPEWVIYLCLGVLMAILGFASMKGLIALAGHSYRKIEV